MASPVEVAGLDRRDNSRVPSLSREPLPANLLGRERSSTRFRWGIEKRDPPRERATHTEVQEESSCQESEGVPNLNSLESIFDKEGLREFGVRWLMVSL